MAYRTDLAVESAQTGMDSALPGVIQDERSFKQLKISTVEITDPETAGQIGKAPGKYVTVTTEPFYSAAEMDEEEIEQIAREIAAFLPEGDGLILAVGLGNNDITPDAIGPRTVHQVLATRHIDREAARQIGLEKLRHTAAIAPGVLGQTGIETSEIISSIVRDIKPCVVIVIDALAARSVSRLGNTIQISNTGISPGSGVMNRRREISQNTLGVPVVSVGVPTVVDASTFVGDLMEAAGRDPEEDSALYGIGSYSMMITPREIDVLIGHACKTLSLAINRAIHTDMSFEEIGYLMS